jgi:hypothetical protein
MTTVINRAGARSANDGRWRLRGYRITCKFRNGAVVTIPTIAANSSQAIYHLDCLFEGQATGYTVRAL